ncbi:MFS transporter [Virgibacillus necropolis]|uniref:MFS transporter n=1 Tax=Virgibacillus necropolis TaxID=163877 RepID=UPI00384B6F14
MTAYRNLHSSIKIRMYLQFATNLASTMIIPFIAIYFSQLVGATITGVLIILVICSGIVGGLIGGYWSDQIGRRKLLILSELGIGISFLAIAFVNSPWAVLPYMSFALFMVNMFCNGIYMPVSYAMIYDLVKKDERNFVFTAIYWVANLSSALGSITGAFLFEDYLFYLFISVAIITLLSSLITYLYIGETFVKKEVTGQTAAPSSIWSSYRRVLSDRIFIIFLIGTLLVLSLESHLTNYIAVHLEKTMNETSLFGSFTIDGLNMVGLLHAENTLLVVLTVGFVAWMVNKTSDYWRLSVGMGFYVCGYALLSYTSSPWLLIGLMVFISLGELMYIPVRQSLLAELADKSYRSSYLALNSFIGQGTMILAGAAITIGGLVPASVISGSFLILGMIGIYMMTRVMKLQSRKESRAKMID